MRNVRRDATHSHRSVLAANLPGSSMHVLDIKLSDDKVLDIVVAGNAAKSWANLPDRLEIGNFYKTFSTIPNNVGPQEKLFFRTYFIGNRPKEDRVGPVFQATHIHIPLFNRFAEEAGEYVSGFDIERSWRRLEDFGQLGGVQGRSPLGDRVVFSETPDFPGVMHTGAPAEIYTQHQQIGPKVMEFPVDLLPLVKLGHQLFWSFEGEFNPFRIHYLFNSKLYFDDAGATQTGITFKFRALYFLESMLPMKSSSKVKGKHMIIGFGVSNDSGRQLRGFGTISPFYADQVSFHPTA